MENRTRLSLECLALALQEDGRYAALSRLDAALSSSKEATEKSQKMKEKADAYAFCLSHFGESSPETRKAQRELSLAKKELDELPLVQEYQACYAKIRRLDAMLDQILFGPFRFSISCGGKTHA